jgi:hypothetical protein
VGAKQPSRLDDGDKTQSAVGRLGVKQSKTPQQIAFRRRSSSSARSRISSVRAPADPAEEVESQAFWWDAAHAKWYELSVMPEFDLEPVLAALLGPARP